MNRFGSHPEAALELEKHGLLAGAEREPLLAHLRECSACRAELLAHRVFAQDRKLTRGPMDIKLDRLAVEAAISILARPARPPQRFRRVLPWALAAALPLSALAAIGAWQVARREPVPVALPSANPVQNIRPVVDFSAEPSSVPSEPESPVPVNSADAPAPTHVESLNAAELFRRAGDFKRAGQASRAVEVYRELQQNFAGSPEAKLSYVVAGGLLFDQGKFAPAISQFDRYLATSGPASEEALVGRANAWQHLGRPRQEAQAWRDLLKRFPGSVHASAAEARLGQLDAEQAPPLPP